MTYNSDEKTEELIEILEEFVQYMEYHCEYLSYAAEDCNYIHNSFNNYSDVEFAKEKFYASVDRIENATRNNGFIYSC